MSNLRQLNAKQVCFKDVHVKCGKFILASPKNLLNME